MDDLIRSARHLGALGWVDRDRVLIQGRSAGGYSTLLALAASDVFLAGASLYGVTDPRSLRRRTHRFESGYLDWLLGDPDRHPMRWRARTPRLRAAAIRAPVIFFQGGRDRVVVPEQTDAMVRAMRAVGAGWSSGCSRTRGTGSGTGATKPACWFGCTVFTGGPVAGPVPVAQS